MDYKNQDDFDRLNKKIQNYINIYSTAIEKGSKQRAFTYGNQWTTESKQLATKNNVVPLTQNDISKHIKSIIGEFSNNFPTPTSTSLSPNVDADEVSFYNEIINSKVNDNEYTYAVNEAFEESMRTGCASGIYIYTDYKNEYSFIQDIFPRHISYTSLIFDPYAKMPTKEDANFCGYVTRLEEEEFESIFGKIKFKDTSSFSFGELYRSYNEIDDNDCKGITVAHIFEKIFYKAKIYQTNEERIIYDKNELLENEYIIKERECKRSKIISYFMDGKSVLKKYEYPFERMPIVCINGYQSIINGVINPYSFGYDVMDLQRVKNWALSQIGSTILNLRKETFLVDKDSVSQKELNIYKNPLLQQGYLPYSGSKGQPPKQLSPTELSQSLMGMIMSTTAYIDNTLGRFEDVQGKSNGNISGIARELSITQNNICQYFYVRNAVQAVKAICKNISEILPKIYVEERIIHTNIGKVFLNKMTEDTNIKTLDITKIDHKQISVDIKVGSSFEIQKEKYLNNMITLISNMPPEMQVILLPELLNLYEVPNSAKINEKISRYLKATQPMLDKIMNNESDEEVQKAMMQNEMQAAQAQQMDMQQKQLDLIQKQKLIEALDEEKNLNKIRQALDTRKQRFNELKGMGDFALDSEKVEQGNIKLQQSADKVALDRLNNISKVNAERTRSIVDLITTLK